MKKLFLFAALTATVLASCAKNEVFQKETAQSPVSFGVYAGKTADTKATYGDITTANLATSVDGFGVFGYYTQVADWTTSSTPNFMYNQQVRGIGSYTDQPSDYSATKYPSGWYYTPLKYWPNGQNATVYEANGTSADKLSFFAYAPHIATNNNGAVSSWVPATSQGITSITSNTQPGVPEIHFTVPAKAEEQIDLLWANPLLDLTKQSLTGRVSFTFKHALSKLNLQVRAVVDAGAAITANLPTDNGDDTVDAGETWILLESLTLTANGTQTGTLSIGSADSNPNWSSVSGNTSVNYTTASFASTKTADGKTGFKVTETATDLNATNSPMIIPGNVASGDFTITANYWVITKDAALASGFSTIQNNIKKTSTTAINFAAGYKYNIIVNLGLNSVDFNVTEVSAWEDGGSQVFDLPMNES